MLPHPLPEAEARRRSPFKKPSASMGLHTLVLVAVVEKPENTTKQGMLALPPFPLLSLSIPKESTQVTLGWSPTLREGVKPLDPAPPLT